jgi:hypothetical protein
MPHKINSLHCPQIFTSMWIPSYFTIISTFQGGNFRRSKKNEMAELSSAPLCCYLPLDWADMGLLFWIKVSLIFEKRF